MTRDTWSRPLFLAGMVAFVLLCALGVVRCDQHRQRMCVQKCRAEGWPVDEGLCERLCDAEAKQPAAR